MEVDDATASGVSLFVFFGTWALCWHQLGALGLFFGWLPAGFAALVWPLALYFVGWLKPKKAGDRRGICPACGAYSAPDRPSCGICGMDR